MQKIRKAVIPAAGLGTRVLPASKACPKEMLNIVDKPAIQYIVEEAVAVGITDILIITNRGKSVIEDHFDHSYELETHLRCTGKGSLANEVAAIADMANIHYIRQKETLGLGHAVLCAKTFVGDEPFAVLYGDDVIVGDDPAIGQLCRAYEQYRTGVVGIRKVSDSLVHRYSSLKVQPLDGSVYRVLDMVEKPEKSQKFSNYSILGRCILTPEIFRILEHTLPGVGGELQLTDAMRALAQNGQMVGVDFTGDRYDMGDKLGILKANVEIALHHPKIGADFRRYLIDLVKNIQE